MTRIDVDPMPDLEVESMPEYQEALRLAEIIARWEGVGTDAIMNQVHYVATMIRLQSEGLDPFDRDDPREAGAILNEAKYYTHPREVRDVLDIRLRDPEQYAKLPRVEIERRFRGDA